MDQFIIDIELFETQVHILNGVSDKEFDSYVYNNFNKQKAERMNTTASCWSIKDKNNKTQFLLDFKTKLKKDAYSINTITHESLHATNGVLNKNSIYFSKDDSVEEVFCCLCAYITGKIYEGIFNK